jgi:hypothetical protein
MSKTPRSRHHHAGTAGRPRPQSDPPRFTQELARRGRPYQNFPLGPGAPSARIPTLFLPRMSTIISVLPALPTISNSLTLSLELAVIGACLLWLGSWGPR